MSEASRSSVRLLIWRRYSSSFSTCGETGRGKRGFGAQAVGQVLSIGPMAAQVGTGGLQEGVAGGWQLQEVCQEVWQLQ